MKLNRIYISSIYFLTTLLLITGALSVFGQEDKNKDRKPITGSQIYNAYDPNAPSRKQNQLQLGLEYYRNRDYEKSAGVFSKLYEAEPTHTNYTYYLYSLIGIKDYRTAEKMVKRQVRNNPGNHRYMVDLGYLYVTLGEVKRGRKIYQEAIKGLPADQRAIRNLANSFVGKRENDLALETYFKGRELLGNSYGFENELASLYYQMQEYEKMVEQYLHLAATNTDKTSYVQNRLQYYLGADKEGEVHEALRSALLRSVQKNPDERFYSDFLLWLSLQEKDYPMALKQALALDRRFDNSGNIIFNVSSLSLAGKDYNTAAEGYEHIISKYPEEPVYESALAGYSHAEFMKFKLNPKNNHEKLFSLLTTTIESIGINELSVQNIRDLGEYYTFYLQNPDSAIAVYNRILSNNRIKPASKQQIKLDLADAWLFDGDPWEATLLLSQVEKANKNEPIGHEAKLRNAKLSYYIGEYGWAEGQLNILKAATTKLIANDAMNLYLFIKDNKDNDSLSPALQVFSHAELLVFRREYNSAIAILDSLYDNSKTHAIADDIVFKKAEIAFEQGFTSEADSLFEVVHTLYPESILADDAIIRQIEIARQDNDNERVAALNEKILFEYPASIFAVEARQEYRNYIQEKKEEDIIPLPETR